MFSRMYMAEGSDPCVNRPLCSLDQYNDSPRKSENALRHRKSPHQQMWPLSQGMFSATLSVQRGIATGHPLS